LNFEGFDSNMVRVTVVLASVTVPLFIKIMKSACSEDSFISLSASVTVPLFITIMESGCYEDSFISL